MMSSRAACQGSVTVRKELRETHEQKEGIRSVGGVQKRGGRRYWGLTCRAKRSENVLLCF